MFMRKVNILKLGHAGYPDRLKHIYKPPGQLYYRGQAPGSWSSRPWLAVVGSRKATAYSLDVTDQLVRQMANYGVVIVSGLAYGQWPSWAAVWPKSTRPATVIWPAK